MEEFQIHLTSYRILSNSADGEHYYLGAEISYNGATRELYAFFDDKADEELIQRKEPITVSGKLTDNGLGNPLLLSDAQVVTDM